MDIISHGLWGGLSSGQKNKKMFWTAFAIGVSPDLFSFGLLFAGRILGLVSGPDWSAGPPDPASIPQFVDSFYNVTHSLVIFALVFGLVWFIRKKPFIPLFAWAAHIVLDIFTHSVDFYPTPFLWPVSDFVIDGISWGQPIIFFPNLVLLRFLI